MTDIEAPREEREKDFSRLKTQGLRVVVAGLVLEIIGAVLALTRWVIYIGEGVEERPFYFGGIGDFLVTFGVVCLLAGGALYIYYDDKLRQVVGPRTILP